MKEYLLSNDDGITAPGLAALAKVISGFGTVNVVAPNRNRSGCSSALTLDRPIRAISTKPGWIAVDGTPADCVHLGINRLMSQDPDMVVAGINAGENLGDDVLYSGTIAAALEGRFLGKAALAVSLVGGKHDAEMEAYLPAAEFVASLLRHWDAVPLPPGTLLNVNVPSLPIAQIKGIQVTSLGCRSRVSQVQSVTDPRGNETYWIGLAGSGDHCGEGTDFHAVAQGYVSVTPIHTDMTMGEISADLVTWLEKI